VIGASTLLPLLLAFSARLLTVFQQGKARIDIECDAYPYLAFWCNV